MIANARLQALLLFYNFEEKIVSYNYLFIVFMPTFGKKIVRNKKDFLQKFLKNFI